MFIARLCAFTACIFVAAAAYAGPIDPPAGPVAPTHKTLTQVEPRTPLGPDTTPGDANATYVISQPGSYYLAGNITGPNTRPAIRIAASNVTLDLGGFTIADTRGITTDAGRRNIVIRNGTLAQSTLVAVGLESAERCTLEDLLVDVVAGNGVRVGDHAVIRRCTVRSSTGPAMIANHHARISECTVSLSSAEGILAGDSCLIERCHIHGSGASGVSVQHHGVVRDNTVDLTGGGNSAGAIRVFGGGGRIEGNTVTRGLGSTQGFRIVGTGNLVVRNSSRGFTFPYNIDGGNTVGPFVTSANIATNSNPHANYEY